MRHKDTAGNEGVIEAGGVQWMTAGKGIEYSEIPEPAYQEYAVQNIPIEKLPNSVEVRVSASDRR